MRHIIKSEGNCPNPVVGIAMQLRVLEAVVCFPKRCNLLQRKAYEISLSTHHAHIRLVAQSAAYYLFRNPYTCRGEKVNSNCPLESPLQLMWEALRIIKPPPHCIIGSCQDPMELFSIHSHLVGLRVNIDDK